MGTEEELSTAAGPFSIVEFEMDQLAVISDQNSAINNAVNHA
jgi:hypothetical protein